LCGTGVTSNIALNSNPQEISPLIACSLHTQIPLTYTSTVSKLCIVLAFEAACSTAICAAYGVASLAHLKPAVPPLDQVKTLPLSSVIETIVLLNEANICACQTCTILLVFLDFLTVLTIFKLILNYIKYYFFLFAIATDLPFLVLELVFVFCPLTGNLFLCLNHL
jgi:hypothetical protein